MIVLLGNVSYDVSDGTVRFLIPNKEPLEFLYTELWENREKVIETVETKSGLTRKQAEELVGYVRGYLIEVRRIDF